MGGGWGGGVNPLPWIRHCIHICIGIYYFQGEFIIKSVIIVPDTQEKRSKVIKQLLNQPNQKKTFNHAVADSGGGGGNDFFLGGGKSVDMPIVIAKF